MLTPIYYSIADGDTRDVGESDRLNWAATPPQLGDRLSLGNKRLWEVIELQTYQGDAGQVVIAHVSLVGTEPIPRAEWFDTRMKAREPVTALRLYVMPDGGLHESSRNFLGEEPPVGFFLNQFDIATRKTSPSKWWVTGFDSFTSNDLSASFDRVYVARVEVFEELTEVSGAMGLAESLVEA